MWNGGTRTSETRLLAWSSDSCTIWATPAGFTSQARWNVSPTQAIEAFIGGTERTIWLEQKRCFESVGTEHVVVWLWMDEQHKRVLVITCVPRPHSNYG